MRRLVFALLAAFAAPQAPDAVDPSLRAAVERFYAMQEAEDVSGYTALWAKTAQDPQRPAQLKFIFDSGDDKFSDLTITSVRPLGTQTVVRLSVTRDRTSTRRLPDGSPLVFHSTIQAALTYVRETGEWRLVREGSVYDALADAVIAAADASEREKALAAEPDLVTPLLVTAISRQADAAAERLDYPRAQALYERALELAVRVGHKKLQADTLQNLANTLYYQRNFAAAKPIYEQNVAVQRELGNDDGVASALVGLGTAEYSQFLGPTRDGAVVGVRLSDDWSAHPPRLVWRRCSGPARSMPSSIRQATGRSSSILTGPSRFMQLFPISTFAPTARQSLWNWVASPATSSTAG